jgi:LDH2 family malate/lactate/ureidoglycolate dehydrogenase
MGDEVRIQEKALTEFCVDVFEALQVPRGDAQTAAEVLVVADLRDKGSHGVARLPRYVDGLRKGIMAPADQSKVVHETATAAVIDGGKSLGQVVGRRGMALAIEKAKRSGAGFVSVRNSNHYGIAGYYAMMALEHGGLGISMTNAAPLVVPTYGRDAILGTNPISLALPADGEPFVLDMATSVVPRGKIEVYDRANKPMPVGWAVDTRGKGTTDAKAVLAGLIQRSGGILPLGGEGEEHSGHKGYGLAVAVELLCAALSGASFSLQTYGQERADIGHFFGAIDVAGFRPLADVKRDARAILDQLRNSPRAEGHDRIYTHGEKGFAAERERRLHGIPLGPKVVEALKKVGQELQVPWKA